MIEEIKKLILKDVQLTPYELNELKGHNSVNLYETSDTSIIKELNITYIPQNSLFFTLDYDNSSKAYNKFSCYFGEPAGKNYNKKCDLVAIWKDKDQYKVLLFDLKSTRINNRDADFQLENSQIFIDFIFNLVGHHSKIKLEDINISYIKRLGQVTERKSPSKSRVYRNNHVKNYNSEKKIIPLQHKETQIISFDKLIS